MEPSKPPFPFMRLPLELREQIYSLYFHPGDHLSKNSEFEAKGFLGGVYQWNFDLRRARKCGSGRMYLLRLPRRGLVRVCIGFI
jgi:hypothetical protein